MSTSLTWQELPPDLLEPVMEGVILLHQAAELWDLFLLNPGRPVTVPTHLESAVDRLDLWQTEVDPTLH